MEQAGIPAAKPPQKSPESVKVQCPTFVRLYEDLGNAKVAEMTGYSAAACRVAYNKGVARQCFETIAKLYYDAQVQKFQNPKLHLLTMPDDRSKLAAVQAVVSSLGGRLVEVK